MSKSQRISSPIERVAYSPPDAGKAAGVGKDSIYTAIKRRDLVARKHGKRTLILRSDLLVWLASLPLYPAGDHDNE